MTIRQRPERPVTSVPYVARALATGLAATLVFAPQVGSADEPPDFLSLHAIASTQYDSNLFSLPDGTNPPGDGQRSATTRVAGVGLALDKSYGQQRLQVDGDIVRNFYQPYSNLDFTGHQLTSTLSWHITPALSGNVFIDRSKLQTDFEYVGYRDRPDPRTRNRTRLDVDLRAGAALHPRFSVLRNVDTSESALSQLENVRTSSAELALLYRFKSNNELQLYGRRGRGESDGIDGVVTPFAARAFEESQYGIRGRYRGDHQSILDWAVGHLSRSYEGVSVRSFSGFVGRATYVVPLTGKTSLQTKVSRTLGSSQSLANSFYQFDVASVGVVWLVSGKIAIVPSYDVRRQSFKGAPVPVEDYLVKTTHDASIQTSWSATRAFDLTLTLQRTNRVSNDALYRYSDRTATVLARLRF